VQSLFSAGRNQCDGTPAMIKTETPIWMIQARSGNGDLKTYCAMVETAEEAVRAVKAIGKDDEFKRIAPMGPLSESAAAGVRQVFGLIYGSIIPWPNDDIESLIGKPN
jgi:hypothetical protein